MTFVVHHSISNPQQFWDVLASNPALPEGFSVKAVLPGTDPGKAVCIWQAPDEASLQQLIANAVGNSSTNTFMQIAEEKAVGLN